MMMRTVILVLAVVLSVEAYDRYSGRYNQNIRTRPWFSSFRQRAGYSSTSRNNQNYPSLSSNNNDRDSYGSASSYSGPSSSYGASSYGYDDYGGKEFKPLAALIAPLAGLALLGAAAAVATSPVLLTIAVLNGRKRRSLDDNLPSGNEADSYGPEISQKIHEMEVLESYIAKVPQEEKQDQKLMSTYLSCSGYTEDGNSCMDRVVCEYATSPAKMSDLEKDVLSIVLYNIMSNTYISKDFKERLRSAAQHGRATGQCAIYSCAQLKN